MNFNNKNKLNYCAFGLMAIFCMGAAQASLELTDYSLELGSCDYTVGNDTKTARWCVERENYTGDETNGYIRPGKFRSKSKLYTTFGDLENTFDMYTGFVRDQQRADVGGSYAFKYAASPGNWSLVRIPRQDNDGCDTPDNPDGFCMRIKAPGLPLSVKSSPCTVRIVNIKVNHPPIADMCHDYIANGPRREMQH